MTERKPYQDRTDLERIESQWHKLSGLHSREEWSAAIVRAATAAEIAANRVIRDEFAARSQFDAEFVDSLLKWANGLSGKIDHLLIPLFAGRPEHSTVRTPQGECKFWLEPVSLASAGGIKPHVIREIERLVFEHRVVLLAAYHEFHRDR